MAAKDKADVYERDRQQRETARLAADAKRRAAKGKPAVTRPQVDILMNEMSPEGRAHVAAMAVYRTGIRPATWPK
jgi:hypothetical protein